VWSCVVLFLSCVCVCDDDDMFTSTGYPLPNSSRHGPQGTQHTASTAATPRYPQDRRPCDLFIFYAYLVERKPIWSHRRTSRPAKHTTSYQMYMVIYTCIYKRMNMFLFN